MKWGRTRYDEISNLTVVLTVLLLVSCAFAGTSVIKKYQDLNAQLLCQGIYATDACIEKLAHKEKLRNQIHALKEQLKNE